MTIRRRFVGRVPSTLPSSLLASIRAKTKKVLILARHLRRQLQKKRPVTYQVRAWTLFSCFLASAPTKSKKGRMITLFYEILVINDFAVINLAIWFHRFTNCEITFDEIFISTICNRFGFN